MKSLFHTSVVGSSLVSLARDIQRTTKYYLYEDNKFRRSVASLTPHGRPKGDILISRNHRCFFLKDGDKRWTSHESHWEVYQLATIFLGLGYAVDSIHYLNNVFVPEKDYALCLDVKWNLQRLDPLLNKDCIRILEPKTTHPLFQAAAELRRLYDLQQRRGVLLRPWRQDPMNWAIEHADCAIFTGNQFTMDTYRYAGKPLYRIPLPTHVFYPNPEAKDFASSRKHFLFLAGVGMVHKGLDRVLEAFAAMPDLRLTVCGEVEKERDFVRAYRKELYDTPNIHLAGWVDVGSQTFLDLANRCVALLHPSCSEAGAGSVVTCMHAGLIPIASVESAVDISPEYGVVLQDSSIEEIRAVAQSITNLSTQALRAMSQAAWQTARQDHSPQRFTEECTMLFSRLLTAGRRSFRAPEATLGNVSPKYRAVAM